MPDLLMTRDEARATILLWRMPRKRHTVCGVPIDDLDRDEMLAALDMLLARLASAARKDSSLAPSTPARPIGLDGPPLSEDDDIELGD